MIYSQTPQHRIHRITNTKSKPRHLPQYPFLLSAFASKVMASQTRDLNVISSIGRGLDLDLKKKKNILPSKTSCSCTLFMYNILEPALVSHSSGRSKLVLVKKSVAGFSVKSFLAGVAGGTRGGEIPCASGNLCQRFQI